MDFYIATTPRPVPLRFPSLSSMVSPERSANDARPTPPWRGVGSPVRSLPGGIPR